MSTSTALSAVMKMLDHCAPGYTIRLATHSRVITFGGKVFPSYPKHDPTEDGHVRKLVRFLGIEACASKHLPGVIKGVGATSSVAPQSPSPALPEHAAAQKKPRRAAKRRKK